MELPRLGVESELQVQAYATAIAIATATWDPSCVCNLYHSSWQCWILNPLGRAREQESLVQVRWSLKNNGMEGQESSCSGSGHYGDAGLIPGLASELKNLVLLQLQIGFSPCHGCH